MALEHWFYSSDTLQDGKQLASKVIKEMITLLLFR